MIVEIITARQQWPAKGEFYLAKRYRYDNEKVTLQVKVDPVTHERLGPIDELVNEYRYNVKIHDDKLAEP